MSYSTRRLLPLLLIALAAVTAGCNRTAPATPAAPLTISATARPLPTRPATGAEATPTATPEVVLMATPSATPAASAPKQATVSAETIVGQAYVSSLHTSLLSEPGGDVIAALSAGDRLAIISATPDKAWLHVRYQPDPDAQPISGWVAATKMSVLADWDTIPAANAGGAELTEVAEPVAGAATVQARRLNLRAGPGVDQPIIGSLTSGQQINVLGRSDSAQWLKIQTEAGSVGWAAAAWLKSDVTIDALPVLAKATTAVPKPVVPQGAIIFLDQEGGAIYRINANGSGLKRIGSGLDPAISPDGSQIAFAKWAGTGDTIRVMNADGSGERVIVGANKPRSPTWSPDGQNLIYERMLKDHVCRNTPFGCLTDDELRQRFNGNDCLTTPFGSYCINDFPVVHLAVTKLEQASLEKTDLRDVAIGKNVYAPRHHPLYPEVLYLDRNGVAVAHTDGSAPPQALIAGANFGAPVYSPDGRYIYVSKKDGDTWNIWRYNADGSGPVALTHPPGLRDRPVNSVAPAVSPDGRFILFLTDRTGSWQLWLMANDGGNQRPFAPQALRGIHFQFDFGRERMIDWR